MNDLDRETNFAENLDGAQNQSTHRNENGGKICHKVIAVNVADIAIGKRLRRVSEAKIAELAESIIAVGLLQPVVVTEDKHLVAGLHRLKACERIGFAQIPAVVVSSRQLQREIAEIDENLIRSNLTVLEQCEQLRRRKELYEVLHPETRRGGYARRSQADELQPADINDNGVAQEAFSTRAAHERQVTERTIQRAVRIAERLEPAVKNQIANLPAALKFTQLMRLAELEPSQQQEIIAKLSDERLSFSKALNALKQSETTADANDVSETNAKQQRAIKKWFSSFSSLLKQFENFAPSEQQIVVEQLKLAQTDLSILDRLLVVCGKKPVVPPVIHQPQKPILTLEKSSASDVNQSGFAPTIARLPLFQPRNTADDQEM